jgi:hypothetical protein
MVTAVITSGAVDFAILDFGMDEVTNLSVAIRS